MRKFFKAIVEDNHRLGRVRPYRNRIVREEKETVKPRTRKELEYLIEQAINEQGNNADLNFIDTSLITDMSYLFKDIDFNGDISKWDVSNVRDMSNMFRNSIFNGDISKWDVSNVEYMTGMFRNSEFNRDISKWDVSNVIDMAYMFEGSFFTNVKTIETWNFNKNVKTYHMLSKTMLSSKYPKFSV